MTLATDSQLVSVAKNVCFAFQRQFLKLFQFFPRIFVTVHYLPHFSLNWNWLKHSVSHFSNSIFASFLLQYSRKRYGFSLSHLISSCFENYFLDFWVVTVVWDILCSNMFLLRLLGICLSGVFIVCFPVVIYWSTLYCDNIGSLMTHEHSLSFSGHSHPVVRVFFIIHMLTLTHC